MADPLGVGSTRVQGAAGDLVRRHGDDVRGLDPHIRHHLRIHPGRFVPDRESGRLAMMPSNPRATADSKITRSRAALSVSSISAGSMTVSFAMRATSSARRSRYGRGVQSSPSTYKRSNPNSFSGNSLA